MNRTLIHFKSSWCKNVLFYECRRFAGHNKWSNIKHIKEEKDSQRAALFHNLKQKMKIAIREGGSTKPSHNLRLAQLIDQAKKANMPAASIASFLEKMANVKNHSETTLLDIKGRACMFVVRISSEHLMPVKLEIQNRIKKYGGKVVDSSERRRLFNHFGHVEGEKDCSLDQAMEDAITVEIIDVEEIQKDNTKYFKFKCNPEAINKISTQLQKLDYQIISTYETCTPNILVELSETQLQEAEGLRKRISTIEGVDEVYDNIAR